MKYNRLKKALRLRNSGINWETGVDEEAEHFWDECDDWRNDIENDVNKTLKQKAKNGICARLVFKDEDSDKNSTTYRYVVELDFDDSGKDVYKHWKRLIELQEYCKKIIGVLEDANGEKNGFGYEYDEYYIYFSINEEDIEFIRDMSEINFKI